MCNHKQFLIGLSKLNIQLNEQAVDNLLLYCQELQKWNKRINLIARHTPPTEIMEKHFLDSLSLLPIINR
ncbi:MAG: 16S rRNA (guanine(527)-N(7))-methyltransferase RsmG, partial [Candidatus Electrothrix sp. AR3]|nr:16S rRNA (guanine(527)-N(7))-methyltransferase RsmG [Candidatus Electrothrix sp. AR3]